MEPENLGMKKVVYSEHPNDKSRKIVGEVIKEEHCIRVVNEIGEMIIGWNAVMTIKNAPEERDY